MLELEHAIVRAKLARVAHLRADRQTTEARLLLDQLDPQRRIGGDGSHGSEAHLSVRLRIEEAHLAMRYGTPEAAARAREILREIDREIGPSAVAPRVAGECRLRALSLLAFAFSQIGDETHAMKLSRFILNNTGFPEDWSSRDELPRPDGPLTRARAIVHLNNLLIRHLKLGYLAHLAGRDADALDEIRRAQRAGAEAERLRELVDPMGLGDGQLVGRANAVRAELELAVLEPELPERKARLQSVRQRAVDVLRESFELPTVSGLTRLTWAATVGMAVLEQALIAEQEGDLEAVEARAWLARAAIQPRVDIFKVDADEPVSAAVRYGEACRLSGAPELAHAHWQRIHDRLVLFRGADSDVVVALGRRIAAISPSGSTSSGRRSRNGRLVHRQ